jgi:hypothetical protein
MSGRHWALSQCASARPRNPPGRCPGIRVGVDSPDPGQIGIPDFPIPGQIGNHRGNIPNMNFPDSDPGPMFGICIGKIPAIFPAQSGRDGAGIGDVGVWWARAEQPHL